MILLSLPDNKACHKHLVVGKDYEIIRPLWNGYVIAAGNGELLVILQERFK